MKKTLRKTVLAFSCLAFATSCGTTAPTTNSPTQVFKPSSSFRLPSFDEKSLANGLTVLYIKDESLPYISYSLLIKGGASTDPADASGLTSFVADLLDQGTSKRSAPQVADQLASIGAEFSASVTSDYSLFGASALSSDADPLLNLFSEIITQPSFAAEEVDRATKRTIAQLRKRVDSPEAFVDLAWEDTLFGSGHPYSKPVSGTVSSVEKLRRKNIIQHYLKYFRPNNSILAVVGKITPEIRQKVESSFAAWEQKKITVPTLPDVPKVEGTQAVLVNKPGLVQSQIRIGHPGIRRNNPDFLTLRLANTILGGAFSSRLVNRVRRDLGLTYSISSGFDARQGQGAFEISTFTKNQTLGKTIEETMTVVRTFTEKGVTEAEVEQAKGYLAGMFPTSIETAEKLAFNLMVLRVYGISDSYLRNYLSDLSDVSASDVNKAIKKYIDPANVKMVVYSSAEVAPQLKAIKGANVTIKKASDYQ